MHGCKIWIIRRFIAGLGVAFSGCLIEGETQRDTLASPIKQASAEIPTTTPTGAARPSIASEPPARTGEPLVRLRDMQREASEQYANIDSYIARLRRREQLNGTDRPEEVILFKFRKEPWSIYFKFLGDVGKGREVVYVRGQHGDEIHTRLAAGDVPLMPAGKRMSFAPNSILVRSASRHSITEAGIGKMVERCDKLLTAAERGDQSVGTVRYIGPVKRPEFEYMLEAAEHDIPSGLEPELPRGGKRQIMFDPTNRLPVLIMTYDDSGREVEYYCYDRVEFPVRLDDDDFNPGKLWPVAPNRQ